MKVRPRYDTAVFDYDLAPMTTDSPLVDSPPKVTPRPLVSVIMPVRNEASFIDRSLGSVLAQSYGLDAMEILIVDGMSDDETRERIAAIQEREPHADIRILDNPGKTAPYALNIGIRGSSGEVVVRVDGHCEIGRHYVAHAVEHLRHGADGVGGPLETLGEGSTAKAIAVAMSSRFGVGGVAFRTTDASAGMEPPLDLEAVREVDTVAFPAYTREVMAKAGPYNEEFVRNQDDEYNYRLRKNGARLLLATDMPARYFSRASFGKLWRQYFQYGYWKVRVLQEHPRQMSVRQFVPPLFVFTLLASAVIASAAPPWGIALWLAVTGSYLIANLIATVVSAKGLEAPIAWRLPLCFALLHLGYGSGFLVGLIRFAGRW